MRHERVYARRQRAVTFAGTTRSVTIPLEVADFERLEQLAAKHNVGNATLVREIIRKYLKRLNEKPSRGAGAKLAMSAKIKSSPAQRETRTPCRR
jgi:predicted DNA-binding ribbon-helix-helix protein